MTNDTEARPRRDPGTIELEIQPSGRVRTVPRPKSVRQLLDSLGLLEETALVIRDGRLLTPDLPIRPGDRIAVRPVGSRG